MNKEQAERITMEFFKRRFPEKNIEFEKKCGYFGEWFDRVMSGRAESFMDSQSLEVWERMEELNQEHEEGQQDHICECGNDIKQYDEGDDTMEICEECK